MERSDPSDEEAKNYALFLADTVVVTAGGSAPDVATLTTPKDWKDVAYFVKDEEEEGSEGEEGEDEDVGAQVGIRKSARTEQVDFKAREEERCVANEVIFFVLTNCIVIPFSGLILPIPLSYLFTGAVIKKIRKSSWIVSIKILCRCLPKILRVLMVAAEQAKRSLILLPTSR